MLIRTQLPLVVFGHLLPGIDLPHISLNLFKMGYELAHQLVQRGHRRFGLLADVENIGVKRLITGIENAMIDYPSAVGGEPAAWQSMMRKNAPRRWTGSSRTTSPASCLTRWITPPPCAII